MTMMTMTTYNDAVKYVPIERNNLNIISQPTENGADDRGCIVAHEVQGQEQGDCAKVAVEAAEAVVEAGHLAEHDAAENTELILEASDVGLEVEMLHDGVVHGGPDLPQVPSAVIFGSDFIEDIIFLLGVGLGFDDVRLVAAAPALAVAEGVVAAGAAAAAAAKAATAKATVVSSYTHGLVGKEERGRSVFSV